MLGRGEIERLLVSCSPAHRLLVSTVLATGLRISEALALVWGDLDLEAGVLSVRSQLSRAHRDAPARCVAPKTAAAVRVVPVVAQLARQLAEHRHQTRFCDDEDWVFATRLGTSQT